MCDGRPPTEDLLRDLTGAWSSSQVRYALGLVTLWKERLGIQVDGVTAVGNALRFTSALTAFHLRGMDRVSCLLLGGPPEKAALTVKEFVSDAATPGRIPFVLITSETIYRQVNDVLSRDRCLVVSPAQLREVLESPIPQQKLKQLLVQQIPKRRLIPYTILHPVEGAMFFGRRNELQRLAEEDDVSFAVAGPGRLGKSSLLKQYEREMKLTPKASRIFYISFYECKDTHPDGIARFLAMNIHSSSLSYRLATGGLVNFIRYQSHRLGGPLDLLLDEVDEVCGSEAFRLLGTAAKQGLCRLVLCGRSKLWKMVSGSSSPLDHRVELMRLEPLDRDAACQLLVAPLADLGIGLAQPDLIVDRILALTGRMPHLLQFYGGKLANAAVDGNTGSLTIDHVGILTADFETAQYFVSPLRELSDPTTRLVALTLLKHCGRDLTVSFIQEVATSEGLTLSHTAILQICNDLVISNVFSWAGSGFRIATGAMYEFARDLGFLESGLREARQAVRERA